MTKLSCYASQKYQKIILQMGTKSIGLNYRRQVLQEKCLLTLGPRTRSYSYEINPGIGSECPFLLSKDIIQNPLFK